MQTLTQNGENNLNNNLNLIVKCFHRVPVWIC